MFKNYLLIALRAMTKNKLYAVINVMGLSIGLSVYLFASILAASHDTVGCGNRERELEFLVHAHAVDVHDGALAEGERVRAADAELTGGSDAAHRSDGAETGNPAGRNRFMQNFPRQIDTYVNVNLASFIPGR